MTPPIVSYVKQAPLTGLIGMGGGATALAQYSASGGGSPAKYDIPYSLRFIGTEQQYMERTPGSAGNQKTWTFSTWIKRTTYTADENYRCTLLSAGTGQTDAGWFAIEIGTDNELAVTSWNTKWAGTTPLLRDPTGWYHIVVAVDTTESTGADRCKIWINGVNQADNLSTQNDLTQNTDYAMNSAASHGIGCIHPGGLTNTYGNFNMCNTHLIDGTALDWTAFAHVDDDSEGVVSPYEYRPRAFSGAYGTCGFHLRHLASDALGTDSSGQGNNWTPNNFNVSAGDWTDYSWSKDVPTPHWDSSTTGIASERGNYATMNSLIRGDSDDFFVFTQGNRTVQGAANSGQGSCMSTIGISTGKAFFEMYVSSGTETYTYAGLCSPPHVEQYSTWCGGTDYSWALGGNSNLCHGGNESYGSGTGVSNVNAWMGFYIDMDNGNVYLDKDGAAVQSGAAIFTGINTDIHTSVHACMGHHRHHTTYFNFGDSGNGWVYGPRAAMGGEATYKPLSNNHPGMVISGNYGGSVGIGSTAFDVVKWTGTQVGSGAGDMNDQDMGCAFTPDMVWSKNVDNVEGWYWANSASGWATDKLKKNNSSSPEGVAGGRDSYIWAVNGTNGFKLKAGDTSSTGGELGFYGRRYQSWAWKAGGNPDESGGSLPFWKDGTGYAGAGDAGLSGGEVTSLLNASINTVAGFSILNITCNGSAGMRIPHGLGDKASFIIAYNRVNNGASEVWHRDMQYKQVIQISDADAATTESAGAGSTWNADPVDKGGGDVTKYIEFGNHNINNSGSSGTAIAYVWTERPGFSRFGKWQGNGNANGKFIHCGFRPMFLMYKQLGSSTNWQIRSASDSNVKNNASDTKYWMNPNDLHIDPNDTGYLDHSGSLEMDFLWNGFKLRNDATNFNTSGAEYIYAAFAQMSPRMCAIAHNYLGSGTSA